MKYSEFFNFRLYFKTDPSKANIDQLNINIIYGPYNMNHIIWFIPTFAGSLCESLRPLNRICEKLFHLIDYSWGWLILLKVIFKGLYCNRPVILYIFS